MSAQPIRASGSQELRVRSEVIAAPPGTLLESLREYSRLFTVVERLDRPTPLPRQRDPQLSEDQWLIRGVDREGRTSAEVLIPDPRLLRAEFPTESGELQGEELYHASADFLVPLPLDPVMTELHIYQPRWTGDYFQLDLLGTVTLR